MSKDEALAFIINTNLSKSSYQCIRNTSRKQNANIYPSYHEVRNAKEQCYPKNIQIQETIAEINLENLLNHTLDRILQIDPVMNDIKNFLISIIKHQNPRELNDLKGVLYCKWGFDGSTGQSEYKQQFSENAAFAIPEKNLFSTTFVPLGN